MQTATQVEIKFIRIREVVAITGLSRATIYGSIRKGTFPQQVKLGPRAAGWVKSEVLHWAEVKLRTSRASTGTVSTASFHLAGKAGRG